jgi:hypothetical protein
LPHRIVEIRRKNGRCKKIEDLRGAAVMSSAGDVQEVSLPQSMFIAR